MFGFKVDRVRRVSFRIFMALSLSSFVGEQVLVKQAFVCGQSLGTPQRVWNRTKSRVCESCAGPIQPDCFEEY